MPARLGRFALDLLILAKYRIVFVVVFTGYAAIAVQGDHATHWGFIMPCLVAMALLGGAANTLNQVFELRKDAVMDRTKERRPLPSGRVTVAQAVAWAVIQFAASLAIFGFLYHSPLAVVLAVINLVYYSFFYTLYLKPRHWLNIVIGGVPGSMAPLIAWAAITGDLTWAPWAMFLIIFLWTPPHVWALAIKVKDDYARAGIPMLPVVKGVDETTRQIFFYTVVLVAFTLLLPLAAVFRHSPLFLASCLIGGVVFLVWTWRLWKRRPVMPTMPLFRYSIIYIMVLFVALMVDSFMGWNRL
jgi:protoheme IX farnesyltransferase